MIPAADNIVACPYCNGLAKYITLLSGNSFDARFWTDGKRDAPMMPQPPAVAKCRQCHECYWLEDARGVGRIGRTPFNQTGPIDPAWAAAEAVEEPGEEDYYHALEKGLAKDRLQERTLRILAWWQRNDAFRYEESRRAWANLLGEAKESDGFVEVELPPRLGLFDQAKAASAEACESNLTALATLLDEAEEKDCLMKAELLRELGQFDKAKKVLSRVTSTQYGTVVQQLQSLCDTGDTRVRELQVAEPPFPRRRSQAGPKGPPDGPR